MAKVVKIFAIFWSCSSNLKCLKNKKCLTKFVASVGNVISLQINSPVYKV